MSKTCGRIRVSFALMLALTTPVLALAQSTFGRVAGSVLDSSGGVLPGATITLTNQLTNQSQTTSTTEVGAFVFPQTPPGTYKVEIALEGFKTATYTDVIVNVGAEYSLTARLELGALTEAVTVEAGSSLVKTTTPEVSSTVLQRQMLDIPLANRDVTNLIKAQPGVQAFTNRTNTSINGGRPTWTQITLDGINIQDNFIRVNGLDFLPNRPTSDNVAEFSITTAVSGADTAGGATTVRMITPSGTNKFIGSVFEFNRDAKYCSELVLQQRQQRGEAGSQPTSVWRPHRRSDLAQQDVLLLQLRGLPSDDADLAERDHPGQRRFAQRRVPLRGQRWQPAAGQRDAADRAARRPEASRRAVLEASVGVERQQQGRRQLDDGAPPQYGRLSLQPDRPEQPQSVRVPWRLSRRASVTGSRASTATSRRLDDRTDLDLISPDRPLRLHEFGGTSDSRWRGAGCRRRTFQNEIRGGGNLSPVQFITDWDYSAGILYNTALSIINPDCRNWHGGEVGGVGFQNQGRYTDTYQLTDSASWLLGRHELQMGGSWQRNKVNPYNFRGQFPQVSFGFSPAAPASVQLTTSQFPGGISAAEFANANALASWLGGIATSVNQTYPGQGQDVRLRLRHSRERELHARQHRRVRPGQLAVKPNLTLRAGLKWEYYSPLREEDDLGFLPVLDKPFDQVMLDPNARVTFVDGYMFKKDLNNFGPTAGFAWDVTKDGKTAVRGGYSLTFVNEDQATVARAASRGNAGLSTAVNLTNLYASVSGGIPLPATPPFLTERTLAQQNALSATGMLLGHRSEHQVSARPPGEHRHPARDRLGDGRRGAVRRHVRAQYLADHRLQPDEDLAGVPR